jgi:hypothetical protein
MRRLRLPQQVFRNGLEGKSGADGAMKMYYRLEDEHAYISIKHVETDRELGYVHPGEFVYPDHSGTFHGCRIFSREGDELAIVTTLHHPCPMRCAAIAVAHEQQHYNFLDLEGTAWNDHNDRIERRVGTLLADTALAFAFGFCEAAGAGLIAETRDKFAGSLAELSSLWWISRYGSFDADDRTEQPYFANPSPGPRLTFSGAAQVYGMRELRQRHPDLSDAERQKVLSWVLQWLHDALCNELQKRRNSKHLKLPTRRNRSGRLA